MRSNMKNILAITVTGDRNRLSMLSATMASVLANVENLEWIVIFQHNQSTPAIDFMPDLGRINNNIVHFLRGAEGHSVAREKAKTLNMYLDMPLEDKTREYVLNIDDDMIIDADTLAYLSIVSLSGQADDLYIATQFDVTNRRKFKDWDDRVRLVGTSVTSSPELEEFIKEHGEHLVAHHLWEVQSSGQLNWEGFPVQLKIRAMSSLWMARIKALEEKGLLNELLLWPKGKRGYDVHICMAIGMATYLVPTRGYHIGLEAPYYNKDWSEHKKGVIEEWEKRT